MTDAIGNSDADWIDLTDGPEVAALHATDAMLDRLGARRPGLDDVVDPLLAKLAVLASDLDASPPSVEALRRELARRGEWPLTAVHGGQSGLPAQVELLDQQPLVVRQTSGPHRPRSRRVKRSWLRPSALGAAAASVLIVGGLVSTVVTGDGSASSAIRIVFGQFHEDSRVKLHSTLEHAAAAARAGDSTTARDLLAQAKSGIAKLPAAQQEQFRRQIAQVEADLSQGVTSGTKTSVPVRTSGPGSSKAGSGSPSPASTRNPYRGPSPSGNPTAFGSLGPAPYSTDPTSDPGGYTDPIPTLEPPTAPASDTPTDSPTKSHGGHKGH